MYAVIAAGGKQYKVAQGDTIKIAKLAGEVGSTVEFDQVLLLRSDKEIKVGTPYVENAKVTGEIVEHGRHKKIHIIKFKRRKHHMKQMGHRQDYTAIKITKISDKKPVKAKPKPVEPVESAELASEE